MGDGNNSSSSNNNSGGGGGGETWRFTSLLTCSLFAFRQELTAQTRLFGEPCWFRSSLSLRFQLASDLASCAPRKNLQLSASEARNVLTDRIRVEPTTSDFAHTITRLESATFFNKSSSVNSLHTISSPPSPLLLSLDRDRANKQVESARESRTTRPLQYKLTTTTAATRRCRRTRTKHNKTEPIGFVAPT